MSRALALLLVMLAFSPAERARAQYWNTLWVSQGGAIGEHTELVIQSQLVPTPLPLAPLANPSYGIAYGLTKPPAFLLAAGTLDSLNQGRFAARLPSQPSLVGTAVYLQGHVQVYPGSAWYPTDLCTWIIAPPVSARFAAVTPPQYSFLRGGEGRALLKDGTVLLCGGQVGNGPFLVHARLFDPKTNAFVPVGNMNQGRHSHAVAPLTDGDALVVGGHDWLGGAVRLAELYDHRTQTFLSLGNIPCGFLRPLAVPVRDPGTGREYVLVAAGRDDNGFATDRALLYDAHNRTFSTLPPMVRAREGAAAVALGGGAVLITGGGDLRQNTVFDDVETFLLGARAFFPWGRMTAARAEHAMVALDATHALVVGGTTDGRTAHGHIELFMGLSRQAVSLPFGLRLPRKSPVLVPLSGGYWLVAGGSGPDLPGRVPEVLSPSGSTPLRPMDTPDAHVDVVPLGRDDAVGISRAQFLRFRP